MGTANQVELFRVFLTRNHAAEFLVECSPQGVHLPVLAIPSQRRPAEELTREIEHRWSLTTYCLFLLAAEDVSRSAGSTAVIEACSPLQTIPHGMRWFSASALARSDFDDLDSYRAAERVRKTLEQYRCNELRGPFGHIDWLRTVTEWVAMEAGAVGLHLDGRFRQLNASATFSLIRFTTDGPALWFKAVGQPNLHEYSITQELARSFSEFLPCLLASRREWNAWLCVEAEGAHLTAETPFLAWQQAASAFARLQVKFATFGSALHLIHAGCKDMRTPALRILIAPFFAFVAGLMEQQTKPSPAPLSRHALGLLAREVGDSLDRLEHGDLPDVLGHMDLNPENILVGQTRCVFLDWAEGAVSHPFLSLEYLREHWRSLHGANPSTENDFISVYAREWRSFASPEAIDAALEHTPLLAAFASAVNGMPWQDPEPSRRAAIAPYLRSLTRRMKREADALQGRRVLCVQ